ncbi:response regulator [uncultured Thiodictyon sp.]|uniref:response regulator n=1 Tax=uncultured Thiodictyon sp. TaxID=1846217 RepID=UPI0025E1D400|nr:response regulator [uncultured Thiodictyon sp.]
MIAPDHAQRIRTRILWPIALALGLFLLAAVLGFYHHAQSDLRHATRETGRQVEALLQSTLDQDAALLTGLLQALAPDPCLRQSYLARDRKRLLGCALPLFADLKAEDRVTHFYVHDAAGVTWLRVHNPESEGDRVERATLRQAAATGGVAHGVELGPFGTLTLRVVAPWVIDGTRVGYLELGEEIDHLAPRIKAVLGVDVFMLIDKGILDRARWEEGRQAAGHRGNWDLLPGMVLAGGTQDPAPATLAAAYAAVATGPTGRPQGLSMAGRELAVQSLPLRDIAGRRVGLALVVADMTLDYAGVISTIVALAALTLGLAALLIGFFWFYLGHIQDTLGGLYGELQGTIANQSADQARLIAQERRLADESTHREHAVAEEQTLGSLLHLALEESPTRPFLEASLSTLLAAVPWLRLQPRGGILLADNTQAPPQLRLAVTQNLTTERIAACAAIPFGTCLCGRAAATREAIHSDGISPNHTHCLADLRDHGHYNVPLVQGARVLGVLVLYLSPGHPRSERELQFLGRVADVLSSGLARRQAAAELRVARDAAEAASRAKSEFLASMSHEIRTPMNGVLGMAELLADMPLGEEQREFVETICKSGQALLTIINDILDFSKIEAGRLELEPLPFDLGNATHEVAQLLASRTEEKGLELILDYRPDCPRYVVGDAGRIRQILLNLAGNAVKFTAKGHVLVSVRRLSQAGDIARIHLRVEDTGIGIAPEVQARLFESFVQADASTTRRFGGTGLGLAISRQLVELMGGEIGVSSELGQGSRFWLTLPLPVATAPVAPPPLGDLAGVHTLIVEDNPVNQRVYQEQLRSFGMRTQIVGDPQLAHAALRAAAAAGDPIKLAVLDHQMPDLDGEQLARQIHAEPDFARLPLVLLTSSGQRGDAERFRQAGFAAYLVKPVLIETLRQCLARVLTPPRVALPAPPPTQPPALTEAVTPPPRRAPVLGHYRGRVLLAEDNAINRKVALSMVRKLGIEADTAENGEEAVARCRTTEYDLILMDCQMPILDGFAATRLIRALDGTHRPAIVALTANAMEKDREHCIDAGMDDYISKPFKQQDLTSAFERWLPRVE